MAAVSDSYCAPDRAGSMITGQTGWCREEEGGGGLSHRFNEDGDPLHVPRSGVRHGLVAVDPGAPALPAHAKLWNEFFLRVLKRQNK